MKNKRYQQIRTRRKRMRQDTLKTIRKRQKLFRYFREKYQELLQS